MLIRDSAIRKVTISWRHLMLAPVRQKLRERRSPKSLEPDKTNISYFVAILRFVAIYVFYKAQIRAKTTFCVA